MRLRRASDAWNRMSYSKISAFQACAFRGFYEFILGAGGLDDPLGVLGQALHYHFKLFMGPHPSTGRFLWYYRLETNLWSCLSLRHDCVCL